MERPFLFYYKVKGDGSSEDSFYHGCADVETFQVSRHSCEPTIGCLQILSSLYTYDEAGKWSKKSNLHLARATIKLQLSEPIFAKRRWFGMASFYDKLIFVTGGQDCDNMGARSEVYCYKIEEDEWSVAPQLNQCRTGHSSCVLGTYLYVLGGSGN